LAYGGLDPLRPEIWPKLLSPLRFRELLHEETDTVEFKQGLSSIQDSLVAFANTLGGVILAGVKNDGSICGLPLTSAVEDKIRDEARNAHSLAPIEIGQIEVGDRPITVIGVGQLREGFAQTSNGRVLVRVGTRRPALIGPDLVRFMHDRAASTFERVSTELPESAADTKLLNEVAEGLGLSPASATLADRLTDRGLLVGDPGHRSLTVAGALYLLPNPEQTLGKTYVELLRFPAGSNDFDRREEFGGPLHNQVATATRALMAELGADSVVVGLRRHELPRLPERVVREAIANAVAHRSYEQRGTPVRVEIRSDRVDISSPGGLVAPVTVETMRDAYAARNNAVIRVLRGFRLAEDSGKGVDVIEDLMRDELLGAPSFSATNLSVTVSLPILGGTRPEERAWLREVLDRGEIEPHDRVLLIHARRGEVLTNKRARELLRTGRDGARSALRRLVEAGLLQQHGQRAGTRYQLTRQLAPPAGLHLTRTELLDFVLRIASEEPVTNMLVRDRTGLDRQDVLSLLDELVGSGSLERQGARRGTRYVIPT
jgi:ATP-dependent DNA helicase RecG